MIRGRCKKEMGETGIEVVERFARMASDGWEQGWHERNGGNLSYKLAPQEIRQMESEFVPGEWESFADGVVVPSLEGDVFLVTAAGSFFRNMSLAPEQSLGAIEVGAGGKAYRKLWGFEPSDDGCATRRPTSELPSHMLIHEAKSLATNGRNRVVYHAHPANVVALTFVLPLDDEAFTKSLWRMISECAMVFPEGVGVLPWMVPGSVDLGRATAQRMMAHNAVIWPYHGLICCEETLDLAFGLMHTIEKASEILVKALSMQSDMRAGITDDNLRHMSDVCDLELDI